MSTTTWNDEAITAKIRDIAKITFGMDLPASVAPFILRGVTLVGVESVMASRERRETAWARLARDLDAAKLDLMTREIALTEAIAVAPDVLAGKVRGRLVVDVNR